LLVAVTHDPRFEVQLDWVYDGWMVDRKRNVCVDKARKMKFDWLVMLDNDQVLSVSPLDIIARAPKECAVIGFPIGYRAEGDNYGLNNRIAEQEFSETEHLGGGVLIIRSHVWQAIRRGPWFKWTQGEGELMDQGGCGEDVYFYRLARKHGFKLWLHHQPAGHLKTVDVTGMVMQFAGRGL
jgi:hypothetical protein